MLPQRIKVFEALCDLYVKRFKFVHVRLIARRAGVPIGTASRELACLESGGLVVRKGSRGGWKPKRMYAHTYLDLLDIFRRTRDYVRPQMIADFQARTHWTIRKHLKVLKSAGLVVQSRQGWKPKRRPDRVPVADRVIEVLGQLYVEDFSFVRTVEIAQRLNVSEKHVRNVLRDYEEVGRVERLGQRGGWKPLGAVVSYEC